MLIASHRYILSMLYLHSVYVVCDYIAYYLTRDNETFLQILITIIRIVIIIIIRLERVSKIRHNETVMSDIVKTLNSGRSLTYLRPLKHAKVPLRSVDYNISMIHKQRYSFSEAGLSKNKCDQTLPLSAVEEAPRKKAAREYMCSKPASLPFVDDSPPCIPEMESPSEARVAERLATSKSPLRNDAKVK